MVVIKFLVLVAALLPSHRLTSADENKRPAAANAAGQGHDPPHQDRKIDTRWHPSYNDIPVASHAHAKRTRGLNHERKKRWPNNGNGLRLGIVNALPSDMHYFSKRAIDAWEAGSPNALRLSTLITAPNDDDCAARPGQIILCSGNYNRTIWAGVEVSESRGENLFASKIILNTYHWDKVSMFMRRYMMCHELGHSLGLEHQPDISDTCMDSSLNRESYRSRILPNQHDYDALVGLYGNINGASGVIKFNQPAGPLPVPPIPGSPPTNQGITCGCPGSCTDDALDKFSGLYTCRIRIQQNINRKFMTEREACAKVSARHPICGRMCNPETCLSPEQLSGLGKLGNEEETEVENEEVLNSTTHLEVNSRPGVVDCGCPGSCTDDALDASSSGYSCRTRINWSMWRRNMTELVACRFVSTNHPICGEHCDPNTCRNQPPPMRKTSESECEWMKKMEGEELGALLNVVGYDPKTWGTTMLINCAKRYVQYELVVDGTIRTTQIRLLLLEQR